MKIGNVETANNVFLAPMAGVTDMPFRLICKEMGCGLTYTEMASSKAFHYSHERTHMIARLSVKERPAAVQIFGNHPDVMAETASKICSEGYADLIDINMGCPAPKIIKNGEGAALMLNPALAASIMKAVVESSTVPVTVKMRKSWDDSGQGADAVYMAKLAEENGAAAVAVHGRTREQYYSGKADWEVIRRVKDSIEIPVVGNGDISSPEDAKGMLEYTGCDAVMIGRAAQGNPWIFSRTIHYLDTGQLPPEPSAIERIEMALRHLSDMVEYKGEGVGVREMRKHIGWYLKGLRNAAEMRERINKLEGYQEVRETLINYLQNQFTETVPTKRLSEEERTL